jgi:hypothetical protein
MQCSPHLARVCVCVKGRRGVVVVVLFFVIAGAKEQQEYSKNAYQESGTTRRMRITSSLVLLWSSSCVHNGRTVGDALHGRVSGLNKISMVGVLPLQ